MKRLKAWESSSSKQEKKPCKRRSTRRHRSIGWRGKSAIWDKRTQNFVTKLQTMMNSFVIKESVSSLDNRSSRSHNLRYYHQQHHNNKYRLPHSKQVLVQVSSTRDLELAVNKEPRQMFKERQLLKNSRGKKMKFKMKWICRIRTTSR